HRFAYIFDPAYRPIEGTTKPELRLRRLVDREPVDVAGSTMLPIAVPHGDTQSFGFRLGDLGYVTDAKMLPRSAIDALEGVRVLVLNALWFGRPHPTHLTV